MVLDLLDTHSHLRVAGWVSPELCAESHCLARWQSDRHGGRAHGPAHRPQKDRRFHPRTRICI